MTDQPCRTHAGTIGTDARLSCQPIKTEAQLDGRARVRCGAEDQPMCPVEACELSAQLFECVDRGLRRATGQPSTMFDIGTRH